MSLRLTRDECKVLSPTCEVAHEPCPPSAQQQAPIVELLPGDAKNISQGIILVKFNQVGEGHLNDFAREFNLLQERLEPSLRKPRQVRSSAWTHGVERLVSCPHARGGRRGLGVEISRD